MKINLADPVGERTSTVSMSLSAVLVEMLDHGGAPSRDEARQIGRLADRIAGCSGVIELAEEEIGLIEKVLDRSITQRPSWLVERLEFLLWPHKLAESDRARLERRYAKPGLLDAHPSNGSSA